MGRNVTLTIDEDLLHRAKILAARKRTTVSQMIREHLEIVVRQDHAATQAVARLRAKLQRPRMRVGRRRWTRDELHERKA